MPRSLDTHIWKGLPPVPILRTPDERFANLPGYPFPPRYVELDGLRMHYVDEAAPNADAAETILCLHGEPTWSYLYRKMIPILAARFRVLAPDLIGFGRSDKYTEPDEYSFAMHASMLARFVETLNLQRITLVCQDWGGLLGLPFAAAHPERFSRLVIMNTGLPAGDGKMTRAFYAWQAFALRSPQLPIGQIIKSGLVHGDTVPPEVLAAYEAPFPDATYKAGARVFPTLVPTQPDQPGAAEMRQARASLATWTKPVLVMFSDGDAITRGGDLFFRDLLPSAQDQPPLTITDAGHFLQEEKGEEIAAHIVEFVERTALSA